MNKCLSCLKYQVIAASRQTWAFSRDGALPFSSYLRKISKSFGYQPLRTVWACCLTAIVLGLLSLINTAAANALFSLAAASNNVAWGIPILCRVLWGQSKFRPGPFYLGRFSVAVSILALLYLTFATFLCMFPTQGPNPDRESTVPSSSLLCFRHPLHYLSIFFFYPTVIKENYQFLAWQDAN